MSRKKKVQPSAVEKRSILGRKKRVPNPDANKTEFDLRSNIGQSEGSQGTLFQVSKRPRSTVGPKGFSPARQDEVRAKTSINADALATRVGGRLENTVHPDGAVTQTPKSVGRRRRAVRQVQDVISQSSAPLEKNVRVGVVAPNSRELLPGGELPSHYPLGIYKRGPRGSTPVVNVNHETFQPSTEPGQSNRLRSPVLLHELGHAYSHATGVKNTGNPATKSGKAEAYADDFSATHSPPSRNGNFMGEYPMGDRTGHFHGAYHAARNTPMSPPKPETQDNGQGRLF